MRAIGAISHERCLTELDHALLRRRPLPRIVDTIREDGVCSSLSVEGNFLSGSVDHQRLVEQVLAQVFPVGHVEEAGSHGRALIVKWGLEPSELGAILIGPLAGVGTVVDSCFLQNIPVIVAR